MLAGVDYRLVGLGLLLCACSDAPPETATTPPVVQGTAERGAGARIPAVEATRDEDGNQCDVLRRQVAAILAEPDPPCESDEDCGCYSAFIDCGGVRGRESADRLAPLIARGLEAGCDYENLNGEGFDCAPWQCEPRCTPGGCMNR